MNIVIVISVVFLLVLLFVVVIIIIIVYYYFPQGGYVFTFMCLLVCLSVSRITEKPVDEFCMKFFVEAAVSVTRSRWKDFGCNTDHDVGTGIFKIMFTVE